MKGDEFNEKGESNDRNCVHTNWTHSCLHSFYHEWKTGKEIDRLTQAVNLISNEASAQVMKEEFEYAKDVIWLEIPDIDLNQMVLPETTEDNLNVGLTQIKPNQTPGEGNFTIAGHRGYRGDRFFEISQT